MKRSFILLLLIFSFNCNAFHCVVGSTGVTIPIDGGSANVTVPVSASVIDTRTLIYDMRDITCSSDNGGIADYMDLTSITTNLNVADSSATANIYNRDSNSDQDVTVPFSGDLPVIYLFNGKRTKEEVAVALYLAISKKPSSPVIISEGQPIFVLHFLQTNSKGEAHEYTWTLIAGNSINVITTTCTINNSQPLDIDFGTVSASDIKSNFQSSKTVTKSFPIHCDDGSSEPVGITMAATPAAGFDEAKAVVTTDPELGIVVSNAGIPLGNGEHYVAYTENGDGNSSLDFTLVKKNAATTLVGGDFTSSAVILITEP